MAKDRKIYILAKTLQSARNIARQMKTVEVYSGEWVSHIPEKEGLRTYSFTRK